MHTLYHCVKPRTAESQRTQRKIYNMTENEISSKMIGACIEVHKQLGPGLLESTYEICLAHELKLIDGLKRIVNNL